MQLDCVLMQGPIIERLIDEDVGLAVLQHKPAAHLLVYFVLQRPRTSVSLVAFLGDVLTDGSIGHDVDVGVTDVATYRLSHIDGLVNFVLQAEERLVSHNSLFVWAEWEERGDKIDTAGDGGLKQSQKDIVLRYRRARALTEKLFTKTEASWSCKAAIETFLMSPSLRPATCLL